MTLGPSLLLLARLDRKFDGRKGIPRALSPLLTFGRVPLFFYILNLYLIHSLAVLMGMLFHQPVGKNRKRRARAPAPHEKNLL